MKKKFLCLLLSLLIVFPVISASALSPKAAMCQKNIDLLDKKATLKNMDEISAVALEIYQLSSADAASLDTSKLLSLNKQLVGVAGSPIWVAAELCNLYGDAKEMKIFGDVFYAKQVFADGEECYYYEFYINDPAADNKPRSTLCIAWPEDKKIEILTAADDGYFTLASFIQENSNADLIAMGITMHMFGGKLIADAVGCQHIKIA